MRTIQELLKDHLAALAHVEAIGALHDAWLVGGAARALRYGLSFPADIDILIDCAHASGKTDLVSSSSNFETSSNGQGQKLELCGVKFDVWSATLLNWLRGVPCAGDGLAIRISDHFVLTTPGHFEEPWHRPNLGFTGDLAYLERHAKSLARDEEAAFDRDTFCPLR